MSQAFKFPILNSLLQNDLRLKIMVTLNCLESASFMYLNELTECSRGNLSGQLSTLLGAEYIEVKRSGAGAAALSVYHITKKGREALQLHEQSLRRLFGQKVPAQDSNKKQKTAN